MPSNKSPPAARRKAERTATPQCDAPTLQRPRTTEGYDPMAMPPDRILRRFLRSASSKYTTSARARRIAQPNNNQTNTQTQMQENKFWSAPWCPPNNILPLLRVLNLKPRGKDGERHSALRAYGHTHPADPVIAAASAIRRRLDARQPLTTADRHLLTCWAQAAAGLTGEVDILGWRFDFSDVLRPYAYKLRGEWHSAMATDKTTLRNIIGERPYDIAAPGDTRYAWPRLLLEDGMLQAYAKRPADKTFRPYNTALRARMSRHAPDTLLSTMLPDTPETRALLRRLSASPDTGAMRMQLRRRGKVLFDTQAHTN